LKFKIALVAAITFGFTTFAAHADTLLLKNTTVDGTLTFGSSSTSEFMPPSVNVGNGKEFTGTDGLAVYGANFADTSLRIRDNCDGKVKTCSGETAFTMTFTDTSFAHDIFTLTSNDIGITYSLTGDVLTIHYSGGQPSGANVTSVFSVSAAPTLTPEPSSIFFLGTGLLGVAGVMRRRFLA
jgi:hypothetical protein